jgi:2-keto-4-pentenoate hydratase/2-oxohepta-3-ene-1,7-dioic acid hydratase in catechol pathway
MAEHHVSVIRLDNREKHMKIISYSDSGGDTFGVVDDAGGVVDMGRKGPYPTLRSVLEADALAEVAALAEGAAPDTNMDAVTLLPVMPNPDKILCAGFNYKDHVAEFIGDLPDHMTVFSRLHNTLVAHGDDIERPRVSDNFDFEGELALIIGRGGRHIAEADVLSHIAGYTCFLDASVRDYQGHSVTAGKNFHRTGPLGPWMVTADEIPDPTALSYDLSHPDDRFLPVGYYAAAARRRHRHGDAGGNR